MEFLLLFFCNCCLVNSISSHAQRKSRLWLDSRILVEFKLVQFNHKTLYSLPFVLNCWYLVIYPAQ